MAPPGILSTNELNIILLEIAKLAKKEFERMKKELNELRMENEILKKATALFTKKQQKNL